MTQKNLHLILIDNNDSFTYNIVNLIKSHFDDVVLDVLSYKEVVPEALQHYDRIIFSPGPQLPQDYPVLYAVLDRYAGQIPILGICLGHQAICHYYGATISHLGRVVHGEPSLLRCDPTSRLFAGKTEATVGRYHSWAATALPEVLRVTALSPDGVVMAVEHRSLPVFGVQFHPESVITDCGASLIRHFIYDI